MSSARPASSSSTGRRELVAEPSSPLTPSWRETDSISRFFRPIETHQGFSHFWRGNKKGFVPGFVPEGRHKKPRMVRSFAGKTSTIRGSRSIRTATRRPPILHNTLLPDGSSAGKEDVERYLLGHAGKDVHAGGWRAMDRDAESSDRGPL